MAFITDLTTPGGTTGVYSNGLPANVNNKTGRIRGNLGDRTAKASGDFAGFAFGEDNPIITIPLLATPFGSPNAPYARAVDESYASYNYLPLNYGERIIPYIQTTIAGLTNTSMRGGMTDSANVAYAPLQQTIVRTRLYKTAIVEGKWNMFNGTFSSITNVVSGVWDIAAGADDSAYLRTAGTDIAANTTADIPGRMTYRDGSPNPIQSGYGPRYNW